MSTELLNDVGQVSIALALAMLIVVTYAALGDSNGSANRGATYMVYSLLTAGVVVLIGVFLIAAGPYGGLDTYKLWEVQIVLKAFAGAVVTCTLGLFVLTWYMGPELTDEIMGTQIACAVTGTLLTIVGIPLIKTFLPNFSGELYIGLVSFLAPTVAYYGYFSLRDLLARLAK